MTGEGVSAQYADKELPEGSTALTPLTILDWLNEDCWKLVLDYVPVEDIIKSKNVSQQWCTVVHRYLEEMGVCIETYQYVAKVFDVKVLPKNRIADLDLTPGYLPYCKDYVTMEDFWREWGPYTVYTYCEARPELDVIAQYCPKLKALVIRLRDFRIGPLSQKQVELCKELEQLVLMPYGKYDNLKFFNISDVKEERHRNARRYIISREFCSNLEPTRLKSLTICGRFNYRYFFADVTFPELTVLNVQGSHANIAMLLQKMPKLERLRLMGDDDIKLGGKVPGLKHITLLFMGDAFIENVVANCCDLQTVELVGNYYPMLDLLSALSRVQDRTLSVSCSLCYSEDCPLTDDEVLKLIRTYPDLTKLDIRQYTGFTASFLPRIARAARRLRLLVHSEVAALAQDQQVHPGLIVEAYPPDKEWDPIPIQYIRGMS